MGLLSVSHTVVLLTGVGQATEHKSGGAFFRIPDSKSISCHCQRTAPSCLALLGVKKARGRTILQPSASSCSLWSEKSIHTCSSAIPGAFVMEESHPLYKVKSCQLCWFLFAPTTCFTDSKKTCYRSTAG